MPTYEYRCRDCGEEHEVVQSFHDDALTECPACGGSLRKLFGNVGITFKGSGFYKTDSRAASGAGGSKSPSGGDKVGSSGGDSSGGFFRKSMRVSSHSTARQQAPANTAASGCAPPMPPKPPVRIHLPLRLPP